MKKLLTNSDLICDTAQEIQENYLEDREKEVFKNALIVIGCMSIGVLILFLNIGGCHAVKTI